MHRPNTTLPILTILTFSTLPLISATPFAPTLQPSLSNTTSLLTRVSACTHSTHWVPHTINPTDCTEALSIFQRVEAQKSDLQRFEFLAPGAQSYSRFLTLHTPRRYYYRSCTIALVMMATFPISGLPPKARRKPYPITEIETLGELKGAAGEVVGECVGGGGNGGGGWKAVGGVEKGLGVFVWESGSGMDVGLMD